MERKTFGVSELKATGPASSGSFEAIVSVFGNVDKGGDRMLKGAFEETLKPPPAGRGFPPIVYSHLWGTVPIGAPEKAEEVEGYKTAKGDTVDGLFIKGDLFVEEHQTAKEVYTAMAAKGGDGLPVLRDFSFGYSPTKALEKKDADFEPVEAGHVRDLVTVDLYEVGPTLVGMNAQASLVDVKSLGLGGETLKRLLEELKAGARNSASDAEMLTQIHDLTTELGVECAAKAHCAGTATKELLAPIFKALERRGKGYDDIDSWAIYLLTDMIDSGSSFILSEDDPADVDRMRAILSEVAQMLAAEIGEVEPDSGITAASLLSGIEGASRTGAGNGNRPHSKEVGELLTAFPAMAT